MNATSLFKIKRNISLNIKNVLGWSTNKKIIVLAVDDYGNVRIDSKKAREDMRKQGLEVENNRFDCFDALENAEDLTQLYDTLLSVKDSTGRPPVFTAFSNVANPDFEKIIASGYSEYYYETLPQTYRKLPKYENVYNLFKEGINKRLIYPEFHGREHLHIKLLMKLLKEKNHEAITAFKNRSYGAITAKPYPTIGYTTAFSFWNKSEMINHRKIIKDGLNQFEQIFGYRAKHFNAPGDYEHNELASTLHKGGIKYIDTTIIKNEHQGKNKYKKQFYYLGKSNTFGQKYMIRNCVFEPLLDTHLDWVDYCMMQISIAFKWQKPAIISTHRVNFAGHIEPENRENGLRLLKKLLQTIMKKWPDVAFLTSSELGDLMNKKQLLISNDMRV